MNDVSQKALAILTMKNTAHIVLQGKGGAGKTTCCAQLVQYLQAIRTQTLAKHERLDDFLHIYDVDSNNQSLNAFKSLGARVVNVLDADENIDKSKFDVVFNAFLEGKHDIVLDTGSSNFHAFMSYMKVNDIVNLALECDKQILFHVPINHDSSYADTCQSLDKICKTFSNANVIVWSNVYTTKKDQVKDITKTPAYIQNDRILGVVEIPAMDSDLEFGAFSKMLKNHHTYTDVEANAEYSFMEKKRIKNIGVNIMTQLENVLANAIPNDESDNE